MKVALVHDWLNSWSGSERVLDILSDLFPFAPIYTLFYEQDRVSQKIRRKKVISSYLQKLPFGRDYPLMYLPLYPRAIEKFDLSEFDLVISSSQCVAKGVRVRKDAIHVCYCISPMKYIWEKFEFYFGQKKKYAPTRLIMTSLRGRLQRWDVESSGRVHHFISASQYVSEKVKKYYDRESEVIYPPIDTDFYQPAFGENRAAHEDIIVGDYFLISADLERRNRIDIAVEAFRNRQERLLIVGKGSESRRLQAMAPKNVTFLGEISDMEILWLYQNCRALICTAEDEFGIAPLEAMSCGRPVIALARGGVMETVIQGKTGILFFFQTKDALSGALDRFNPDHFNPTELCEYAWQFSSHNCFKKLKTFFHEKAGLAF